VLQLRTFKHFSGRMATISSPAYWIKQFRMTTCACEFTAAAANASC
jgi:hypothetical protein